MEVDYVGMVDYIDPVNPMAFTLKVEPAGIVDVYAAKADGIAYIGEIDPHDFDCAVKYTFPDENGKFSEFQSAGNMWIQSQYGFYDEDADGNAYNVVKVYLLYYPLTGNLYNIIYREPENTEAFCTPYLAYQGISNFPFHAETRTLTYGDFTFEMSQFAIQCDENRYVYDYRPGMSLSDWACSELNTDGWIPWLDDAVLSPDRKYICYGDYRAMEEYMHSPGIISAYEYDGSISYFSKYADYEEYFKNLPEEELLAMELEGNDGISVTVAHMVNASPP